MPIAEPIEDNSNSSMMSNGNHMAEAAGVADSAALDGATSAPDLAQDSAPGSRSPRKAASAQKAFQRRSKIIIFFNLFTSFCVPITDGWA